jgi:fructosamine-3-kinase
VIPEVISHNNSYLLLEYLEEEKQGNDFQFGVDIAKLHKSSNELFGFSEDNYIGPIDQSNRYHADWLEFFIRERIEPLVNKAMEGGLLSNKYSRIFERVFNYTYVIFPDEPPALLHGDLWSGNYLFTKQGQAAIYDPAVYYGHREMELAMTTLFGGFNPAFYDGYQTEYPLQTGWEERQKLCQLYPLLVHALLFGGNYVQQSKALLDRFF